MKLALAPARPLRLFSRAPKRPLLNALRGAGVPAKTSIDAGRYLCNASYFAMLDDAGPKPPLVAFVHIPMPRSHARSDRRPTLQAMSRGLTEAALVLLARAQRCG